MLFVLNIIGLVLAILLVLETFRPKPMWPRIEKEKSASPRQRRWMGFALLAIMSGNMVNWLNMADAANLGFLAAGTGLGFGLILLIVSAAKGPTDEELERRERTLSREGS